MFHPLHLEVTDRSIEFDPKAIANPYKYSFHGSCHRYHYSALCPYLLHSLLVIYSSMQNHIETIVINGIYGPVCTSKTSQQFSDMLQYEKAHFKP